MMDDDLDKLTEHLTIPQKMALAKCIAAIMRAENARKQASQKAGEIVFSRPASDILKTQDTP